jgi:hypothetical protein
VGAKKKRFEITGNREATSNKKHKYPVSNIEDGSTYDPDIDPPIVKLRFEAAKARYNKAMQQQLEAQPELEVEDNEPQGKAATYAGLSDADLGIRAMDEIESRPINWAWPYRFAYGSLALTAGEGGCGKSRLLLAIAATVSVGGEWPDGSGQATQGNVVIVSAEDSPEETIKPVLIALDADMTRISIVKAKVITRRDGQEPVIAPQTLVDHFYWQEVFKRLKPSVFIVDPLPSYIGPVDDANNCEVRQALEPFLDAVIAPSGIVMIGNTHLNKNTSGNVPMHRILGSVAYGNLARNVHFVVRDTTSDPTNKQRRLFVQAKCNNAPDNLPGVAYELIPREVDGSNGKVEVAIPVFTKETVKIDLQDALRGAAGPRGKKPLRSTAFATWLFEFLKTGQKTLKSIIDAARGEAFLKEPTAQNKKPSLSPLYNAKERLPETFPGWVVVEVQTTTKAQSREIKVWTLEKTDQQSNHLDGDDVDE